jgi:hypothetical protein
MALVYHRLEVTHEENGLCLSLRPSQASLPEMRMKHTFRIDTEFTGCNHSFLLTYLGIQTVVVFAVSRRFYAEKTNFGARSKR